jgi:hypothetical protein
MSEVKVTKKDLYAQLKAIVEASEVENADELVAFIDHEVNMIESKAAKAAERSKVRKAEGDELRETVFSLMTNDLQTVAGITARIDVPEITRAKVVARLNQLVNAERIQKETITVDGHKTVAYRLA